MKALRSENEGAVAVEFALVASFILVIMLFSADFGLAYSEYMKMANTTRAAAQFALVRHPTASNMGGSTPVITASELRDEIILQSETIPDGYVSPSTGMISVTLLCGCPWLTPTAAQCGTVIVCTPADNSDPDSNQAMFVEVTITWEHDMLMNYPGFGGSLPMRTSHIVRLN